MGRPRALVAVLAGALLLAGCGSGPSQVGAAVIIGDKAVSVDRVQGLIDKAVREQPYAQQLAKDHKLAVLGREVVRQLVLHDVITRAAQQEKLGVNESQLAQVLQKDPLAMPAPVGPASDAASSVTEAVLRVRDHRESLTDTLLQQELALKYLSNLSVTFDYTAVSAPQTQDGGVSKVSPAESASLRDQAFEKAKLFASGPDVAAQALKLESQSPTSQAVIGQKRPAVQSPAIAATVLFGAPINTVAAFQPEPGVDFWVVGVIRERTAGAPISVDQAPKPTSDDLIAIGRRLLEPYLGDVSFRVNPRYGVWDVVGMDLASSEATKKGIVLPVRGAVQSQP
ncbi:hypothetical protein [Amycolatopsis sp. H20-H5]|uniref:hypothetical protein n=1 Tax=Amycolatopsis sp. H20-H5 TaxID=3046309 RepID=UPI002DB67998|nr:hypothetical protein [Amycolatopsis sp. H20-H5]MEC3975977.1 hypothetical protein [Amycolatopsis sp. H20-H5]